MTDVLLTNAIAIACLMLTVWLISLPRKDVSIVDLAWGLGFVLIAWVTFGMTASAGVSRSLLVGMTTLWGLRLGGYLTWRNYGRPEDRRYAAMREKWGAAFGLVSLLTVFLLQGAIMWVVSLPVQAGIVRSHGGWSPLHMVGLVLWAAGFCFEAVGDWQLARFKSDPANKGAVLDRGLWRYTRHPNYFGDFCVWWGIFLVGVAGGAPWWTAVGPLVMSVFLMFISGVTLLEKDLKGRKPDYAAYVRSTSAFFPRLPKDDG